MTVIIILLLFRDIQTFILAKPNLQLRGTVSSLHAGLPLIFIFIRFSLFWKTWGEHR